MTGVPIYSKNLLELHNWSGPYVLTAPAGGPDIIRQITLYYGGDPPSEFFLNNEVDGCVWRYHADGAATGPVFTFGHWEELHLVIEPGAVWNLVTDEGWDISLYGYSFTS